MEADCQNVVEIAFERAQEASAELLCANDPAAATDVPSAPQDTILDVRDDLDMGQKMDDNGFHGPSTNRSNDLDVEEMDVGHETDDATHPEPCVDHGPSEMDSLELVIGQKPNVMIPSEPCANYSCSDTEANEMEVSEMSHLYNHHSYISLKSDIPDTQDFRDDQQSSMDTQEAALSDNKQETVLNQGPEDVTQKSDTIQISLNRCPHVTSLNPTEDEGSKDLQNEHCEEKSDLSTSNSGETLQCISLQSPSGEPITDNAGNQNLDKSQVDSLEMEEVRVEQGASHTPDTENPNVDGVEQSSYIGAKCTPFGNDPDSFGSVHNLGIQENLEPINVEDAGKDINIVQGVCIRHGPDTKVSDVKLSPDNTIMLPPEVSVLHAITEQMAHTETNSYPSVACAVPGVCSVCQSLFTQTPGAALLHSNAPGQVYTANPSVGRILHGSVNPQLIQGCIVTRSEGKNSKITQYLILQEPEDASYNYPLSLSPAVVDETSKLQDSSPGPACVSELESLEGMVEVVVVQQYKCKMCRYKSSSKATLLRHVKERHIQTDSKNVRKDNESRFRPPEEEEEDDDIIDAGAIDDPDGDSDYSPGEEVIRSHQFESPAVTIARERPRRMPGRPRKIQRIHGPVVHSNISQIDVVIGSTVDENKDPTCNSQEEQKLPTRNRGPLARGFGSRKYRKYRNRRYFKASNKQLVRPFLCRVCGSRFLTHEEFNFHVTSHDGNDPQTFRCLQCNYRCRRWTSLKEHMFKHNGSKPHKCDQCDYTSVYRKDIIRHSSVHKRESKKKGDESGKARSYPCPVCSRVYTMQKRLTQHLKTHSAEKPHMCDKCGKAFKKRYTFKMHCLTHLQSVDSSRYKCEFCDYICEDRKRLLNHQLTHMNDKPFKCTQCQYRTNRQDFLLSHQATRHAGGKPFACDYCQFSTKHKKNVRLHVKSRHPHLFQEWDQRHPEDIPSQRQPFFSLQQIEELKHQHEQQGNAAQHAPEVENPNPQLACDELQQPTQQVIEEQSPNTLQAAAIIYDQGEEELTTRAALDLLLNMSAQRDGSAGALQVAVVKSGSCVDGQGADVGDQQPQMAQVLTLHMDESEVADIQQAGFEETGLQQITINTAFTAAEYSLINAENIQTSLCSDADLPTETPQNLLGEALNDQSAIQVLPKSQHVQLEQDDSPQAPIVKKFSCRLCSSTFWGRAEMESHKKAHIEGGSGFKCHDCNYVAASWAEIRDHMTLHADLRPHRCDQCSFATRNKKDLSRHVITHTNHRPHICHLCEQRFNRKGHLKFHMQRVHNEGNVPQPENEVLAELETAPCLEEERIFLSQEESIANQENTAYIQEFTTADGQTLQQLVTGDNQVRYIISQEGVPHLIPQEYVVIPEGHHIQVQDGQITHIQYDPGAQFLQDPQIHFVPMSPTQQLLTQEQLEAAAHSAVTAVADAAMAQTVYTTESETTLQHDVEYDVITLTD
uniref:Zinc finger protein 335 n=1 Tax=Leptobrachium leishanense TaxID=445787 RepID=A0A8C5R678_9ANUR